MRTNHCASRLPTSLLKVTQNSPRYTEAVLRELFGRRGTSITDAPCLDIDNSVCIPIQPWFGISG
ncbi:hypothetical protein [Nostoc sp. CHAB 5715]|uniref:hypothetical protein n=1 Tax=Nostoc sp. CHAB 5715 TaxID=2780400 RepID=UPI001E403CFF|nr:hypothetical protein [Nostoc sp. CHAB 5715]MCC5622215.1 hypothetical protein [Nostoc sp. CHAB 5715]